MSLRLSIVLLGTIAFVGPFAHSSRAQGQVVFNNRVPPNINARFMCSDGIGLGPGITAQLFGGPAGTPASLLTPLFPTTTFRSGNASGYVIPVDVTVPSVPSGAQATIVMRAYFGPSWQESTLLRIESAPITVTVGGGIFPPANLFGLQGATILASPFTPCIPEPTANVILVASLLGIGWAALRRRMSSERLNPPLR